MAEPVPEMTPERRREVERIIVQLARLLPPHCELEIVIVDGWPRYEILDKRIIPRPKA